MFKNNVDKYSKNNFLNLFFITNTITNSPFSCAESKFKIFLIQLTVANRW